MEWVNQSFRTCVTKTLFKPPFSGGLRSPWIQAGSVVDCKASAKIWGHTKIWSILNRHFINPHVVFYLTLKFFFCGWLNKSWRMSWQTYEQSCTWTTACYGTVFNKLYFQCLSHVCTFSNHSTLHHWENTACTWNDSFDIISLETNNSSRYPLKVPSTPCAHR